jgi:hypothetical protein
MTIDYRDVLIKWHDSPEDEPMLTTVAIAPNWTEEDDDPRVFFYFQTEEELDSAKQEGDNGFEFRVVEED